MVLSNQTKPLQWKATYCPFMHVLCQRQFSQTQRSCPSRYPSSASIACLRSKRRAHELVCYSCSLPPHCRMPIAGGSSMGSLHQCLKEGRYHQFSYLVKLGVNLEEMDEKLHTPLIRLCHLQNIRVSTDQKTSTFKSRSWCMPDTVARIRSSPQIY